MTSQTNTKALHTPGDLLQSAISARSAPVCVGLDPVLERLPAQLREGVDPAETSRAAAAIQEFSIAVLDAVAPFVPAVKFQSACYERYHAAGVEAIDACMAHARQLGLVVIFDGKRGDIGITAEHYAAAVRGSAHWVTANSYLGDDGLAPLLEAGLGVFALVRTSNPSAAALQNQRLADGRTVAETVAAQLHELSLRYVSAAGVSALGAVVGATDPQSAARLRNLLAGQMILVPGYGAQGGTLDDVLPCFESGGQNALVTASRSVIYAFEQATSSGNWRQAISDAAQQLADDVGKATNWR